MVDKKIWNYGFLVAILVGCNALENNTWKDDMEIISHLNCQAIQLREARFALADSMRAYQDSLVDFAESTPDRARMWKSTLQTMEHRKEYLANTSRNLSDTIRVELMRLTKNLSPEEKRVFKDSIQARTERLNCIQNRQ
ncbi:MAG TPA: hypothetical protein VKZ56_10690 [Membranihabitans sp.]|nr:hypothetical protein [Membranihabitans sp.]